MKMVQIQLYWNVGTNKIKKKKLLIKVRNYLPNNKYIFKIIVR